MTLARLATVALGVWLMAAPAALDLNAAQSTSLHVVGPVVVALSLAATAQALQRVRLLLLPLAVWLIVAPWLLGGTMAAVAASAIVGVLLIPLACVPPARRRRDGGGWRAVGPLLTPHPRRGHDART